jgi:dGTP triphosphohydrolase
MRKELIENAAYDVAVQVRAVEDSIEAALMELAELQTKMVHARGVTGAGFANSHAAFEHLASTTSGLVSARGGIANCHVALVETRKTIPGLRTTGFGPQDCPKADADAGPSLRIVS